MNSYVYTRRFAGALLFLLALLIAGSAGYMGIEGWSLIDAFYMTVITVTAVGYDEVQPLTQAGRTFTVFLLGGGITFMGVWFALITSLIVELDLTHVFRSRRIVKSIDQLEHHVIVCGIGRTGRHVVDELDRSGTPWVAIEKDADRVNELLQDRPDGLVITGNATLDDSLREAGVARARGLVSCLSADTDNLFVCLSARDLNADLTIVARAYEEETTDKLRRAGATHVVSPNMSGAMRMASMLLRPSVVSFLDIATRSSNLELRMEQLRIEPGADLAGSTLEEARIPLRAGLIVIATRKDGEGEDGFAFNPSADTRLDAGDDLIVLGTEEQIEKLRAYVA